VTVRRKKVTAVEVRCSQEGCLVASLHPVPALGRANRLELLKAAARYRPTLAKYARGVDAHGWVTVQAERVILTLQEFDARGWQKSAAWACRCGTGTLNADDEVSAAYSWSAERRISHGNPPPPRVVILGTT
jgi:hypothetical protein